MSERECKGDETSGVEGVDDGVEGVDDGVEGVDDGVVCQR